jgi:phosphoribosylformylglycinamidine synthase subunit PurQ / glutaminase
MRVGVIVFPGSNGDADSYHAIKVLGEAVEYIWHSEPSVAGFDALVLPGGFSYGDALRAGAIARFSPIMAAVRRFAADGGPVLGICNGFQVLTEAGLLPGALRRNAGLSFQSRWLYVCPQRGALATPFTAHLRPQPYRLPIANGEGSYYVDPTTLRQLEDNGQVVLRYCDAAGNVVEAANPNGSVANIAGVCNRSGNVVGLMPHPERATEAMLGSADGLAFFQSLRDWHSHFAAAREAEPLKV